MPKDIRYVTTRTNADGTMRYDWRRKGHKLVNLSTDPENRFAQQHRLNLSADRSERIAELDLAQDHERAYPISSLGWVIATRRPKFGLSDQQIAILQLTRSMAECNVYAS
jgi:hypothetical protein